MEFNVKKYCSSYTLFKCLHLESEGSRLASASTITYLQHLQQP